MSKLDPKLIKKYFKNQRPPDIKDLQARGLKFTDPYFTPNTNSLVGKDASGHWIDQQKSLEGIRSLESSYPGCTRGGGCLQFKRISEMAGDWKVFEDKIEMNDVKQGTIGDCYFLTAISVLSNYPYLIMEKFRTIEYNPIGYYEVILFIDGEWQVVFLDDYFVCDTESSRLFAFAKPNNKELWAILLEKAWAKVNGGYVLIEGGLIHEGFQALTGFPSDYITHKKTNARELYEKILEGSKEKTLMGCSSTGNNDRESYRGIVQGHAYALAEAKSCGDVELIKVRNPWGQKEWDGPWSDNSPLWTPKLRQYFGCVSKDDGIFWIDYSNFYSHFSQTTISYILYGSIIKSITIDKIELLMNPLVFNINIQENGKFSINTLFRNWRFNRELGKIQYPVHMILAKYNARNEIESIYAQGDHEREVAIIKDLTKGNYVFWIFLDYNNSSVKRDLKYTLRMACSSSYSVEFMGQDDDCKILEYIILNYNKRYNDSYKLSSDYYIGSDQNLSDEGIFNSIIYNKSRGESLYLTKNINYGNVNLIRSTDTDSLEIPPMGSLAIIGTSYGDGARFGYNYQQIYLDEPQFYDVPDYTQILSFMTQNVKEENTERRGLIINAYKYVGKEQLQDLPIFNGIQQAEEEEKRRKEEEKKKLEEEEKRKKEDEERKRKEMEKEREKERKIERERKKEKEDKKEEPKKEEKKEEPQKEEKKEEPKKKEKKEKVSIEELKKKIENDRKMRYEAEKKRQQDRINWIYDPIDVFMRQEREEIAAKEIQKWQNEEKERRKQEDQMIKEAETRALEPDEEEEGEEPEKETKPKTKIDEEIEQIKKIEEQKRKEEEEKERKRQEEIQNQKLRKVTYQDLQKQYTSEMKDLEDLCPEISPFNQVPRDWVIIKLSTGEYVGEVKTGTDALHGRGMVIWTNNDYVNYSYFAEGLAENKSTIKKRGSNEWSFSGAMKKGKRNGKGTFISKRAPNTHIRTEYFVGNFVDDFMEGEGTMYYENKDNWYGNFSKNKKHGVGIFYSGDKKYSSIQKYENDVFVREIPITEEELNELKDNPDFFKALNNYFNLVVEKEKVVKSLVNLPEESEESRKKRVYYETLEKFKEEEPFMMQIYLRLHDIKKSEDSEQYNLKKIDYGSGKLYIGQVSEGSANGKGVLRNNSWLYAGFWVNGLPNAFFYIFYDGILNYKGIFNNWNKVGQGTVYEKGHPVYKGDISFDKQSGYGIKYLKSRGEFFQGEFNNGEMKNDGKYYTREGLVYQEVSTINGEINKNDLYNKPYNKTLDDDAINLLDSFYDKYPDFISKLKLVIPKQYMRQYDLKWGTITTKEGDIFIGQLNEEEPYGLGGYIYNQTNKLGYYVGYVKHGLPNEQGIYYTKDWKVVYEGGFEYGKKTGYGIEYNNESTYLGYFSDDKRSGIGVIIDSSMIYEGNFVNGKKQGQGYVINKKDKIVLPVKCLQGNIEKEENKIKCAILSKVRRNKQMESLLPKYQKFNNMFLQLTLDPNEQMYLNIIHKEEDGTTYIGECNYAQMKHGRGVLIDHFYETYYLGYFKYDKEEGEGTLYRMKDDQIVYQGNFHLGKPLGKGSYYYYEPVKYQIDGEFNEIGEGKGQEIRDEGYWEGSFFAWMKNGSGEMFNIDGESVGKKNYVLDQEVS